MKIGMVVRADDGGLGAQTWEIWRHVQPDKSVVIDMSALTRLQPRFDRYPGVPVVAHEQWRDPVITDFLDGLDVVFTAETPYNYALFKRARELGVRTVLHANYEFLDFFQENVPVPDSLWMASLWNYNKIPYRSWGISDMRYVPTPVDRERCKFVRPPVDVKPRKFLHIHGQETINDRNGTEILVEAMPLVLSDVEVVIYTQHPLNFSSSDPRLSVRQIHIGNYWDLYRESEVLILPRRYGGQSLQMQEALSSGLPVISTDVDPQRWVLPRPWLIGASWRGQFNAKTAIDWYEPSVTELAAKIDWFANRRLLPESDKADRIAETLSWDIWTKKYRNLFEEVKKL